VTHPALAAPSPVLLRVALGDVVDVNASLVAVGHVNDVAPTGAEQAIDDLLGGAITERQSTLRGRLGTTHYLPTITSPLAVGCVLVVCLGDAEHFTTDRLSEVGAAVADAAASIGVRDAATIVPAARLAEDGAREAAQRLVAGLLAALERIGPERAVREITIVERDPDRFEAVLAGIQEIATQEHVTVYAEPLRSRRPPPPARAAGDGTPEHLRLGLTRYGPNLKVTRIGDDAFDRACIVPYPTELSESLARSIEDDVLHEEDAERRTGRLDELGHDLAREFIELADLDTAAMFAKDPGEPVVLRLDASTVDLPWELARLSDGRVLGLEFALGRQVELGNIGRTASWPDHDGPMRALVIGNAVGGLPGAVAEAKAVKEVLERRADAEVELLSGVVSYEDVSERLDACSYDVLHYAGHAAYVEGRPDASGFVLADHKLLTPDDLATRVYVPRLVVANACHSAAAGKPVGVSSEHPYAGVEASRTLVSGLLGAGARAFVGAQWQVPDKVAVTFAGAFYEAVAPVDGGPQPIGEAMRRGRRAVCDAHPGQPAWAAYALYGNPWRTAL
jgi:hypothetical protein